MFKNVKQLATIGNHLQRQTSNYPLNTHSFTLDQFLLSSIKVKVDIETFKEFSDWVSVGVGFL